MVYLDVASMVGSRAGALFRRAGVLGAVVDCRWGVRIRASGGRRRFRLFRLVER